MIKKITKKEEFSGEIGKDKVLVDFSAQWCGPCRMIEPILEELSEEYKIVQVDVDLVDDLATEYGVMSIPTLMLFKGGNLIRRETGFRTKEEIIAIIEEK